MCPEHCFKKQYKDKYSRIETFFIEYFETMFGKQYVK